MRSIFTSCVAVAALVTACGQSTTGPDTTPPAATLTGPPPGAVSGIVTLSVTATDNRRVAYVRWRVNQELVTFTDSVAPFAYDWDTSKYAAGIYQWEALATDGAGNIGVSAPVTYTIAP